MGLKRYRLQNFVTQRLLCQKGRKIYKLVNSKTQFYDPRRNHARIAFAIRCMYPHLSPDQIPIKVKIDDFDLSL